MLGTKTPRASLQLHNMELAGTAVMNPLKQDDITTGVGLSQHKMTYRISEEPQRKNNIGCYITIFA